MTRIAFLDVDGTILEHGTAIADSTITAIRTARENGHLVYLCTGRAAGDIHRKVRDIGYDGAITNGGAYAVRGDELLFAEPMPREDTDRLISYFDSEDIDYFLQSNEAVYASEGVGGMLDVYFAERRKRHLEDARRLGQTDAVEPKPIVTYRPISEADLDKIAKTTFISKRSDSVDRAQTDLGERFHVIPGSIPLPGGSNGEIGLAGTNKGTAIVRVLDILGLDAADAVGIGDSWNDAEMFDVVGSPVAMGNADPALKERAGNVTTDVLDDGVWNAFVKLGLV
ncbi:Cof-type HAD-IIB family hydrolase [Microbacterium oleivorans]|uniref:Putative hydrolase of the HAD superfamily protein n=1 Tax=Microbacterium oleivorans TaxID=273677 RepID=A0A031FXG2_9MICO|nr:Cof-type HAD-IIB family hydrolase [Microbacterium oleivorans]EZP29253.1 putative hydrolase of the HAD superfamily protein [Microbacterium oleivorans]THE08308.1 Cof-type HAD-IIB family hydrolase [Microbacterium oleivorans]